MVCARRGLDAFTRLTETTEGHLNGPQVSDEDEKSRASASAAGETAARVVGGTHASGGVFKAPSISGDSSLAPSSSKKVPLEAFSADLIERRPGPLSGAQGFHQRNNGPASWNNQRAPTPASPRRAANSSERP